MLRRPWSTVLALLAGAACLIGCRHAHDEREASLGRMHEACVTAMIASTCQVMVGSAPADAAPTVLIAGVGRIDAQAYRALRESGDAMCSVARAACGRDWDGASCRSARALWALQPVASR